MRSSIIYYKAGTREPTLRPSFTTLAGASAFRDVIARCVDIQMLSCFYSIYFDR